MCDYLFKRICDISDGASTKTVLEYIRDLETCASTTHEDLSGMNESQLDDYIEWLYLACIM